MTWPADNRLSISVKTRLQNSWFASSDTFDFTTMSIWDETACSTINSVIFDNSYPGDYVLFCQADTSTSTAKERLISLEWVRIGYWVKLVRSPWGNLVGFELCITMQPSSIGISVTLLSGLRAECARCSAQLANKSKRFSQQRLPVPESDIAMVGSAPPLGVQAGIAHCQFWMEKGWQWEAHQLVKLCQIVRTPRSHSRDHTLGGSQ